MEDKKITRIILKEDDILLVKIPVENWKTELVRTIYEQIKKQIFPKKNKILILPSSIDISVIGKDEIEEYISKVDLWELWELWN